MPLYSQLYSMFNGHMPFFMQLIYTLIFISPLLAIFFFILVLPILRLKPGLEEDPEALIES